jgi:hypothetical protein
MLRSLAALRCACSYEIVCEVRPEGQRIGTLDFFDAGRQSGTQLERVTSCPGCGRRLGLHLL